jgi:mono/diheme cytochrome c family protein
MKTTIPAVILISLFLLVNNTAVAQRAAWIAPKSADALKNPFSGNTMAANKGKMIFRQTCALCHGMKGDGTGGGGVGLDPKPANFLSAKVKDETDGALFWKMSQGNPPMASYKDIFSEDQRWELVNYIRVLEKQQ